MKVIYVGGSPAVSLQLPDGRAVTVARGEAVSVEDEHGARLLEQAENWQPAPAEEDEASEQEGGES